MKRPCSTLLLAVSLLFVAASASAQNGAPAPVPATAENAASFLGNWTVEANGSYGPVTLEVALKAADGKVSGEVSSTNTGKISITDVSKSGASLVFVFAFDYNGMAITAVVTLTPGDKKIDAYIDMASGAASFSGTATKRGE